MSSKRTAARSRVKTRSSSRVRSGQKASLDMLTKPWSVVRVRLSSGGTTNSSPVGSYSTGAAAYRAFAKLVAKNERGVMYSLVNVGNVISPAVRRLAGTKKASPRSKSATKKSSRSKSAKRASKKSASPRRTRASKKA